MLFSKTKAKVVLLLLLLLPLCASSQVLKKLGKKAQRAAERTVERRVERETEKKTDQVLDSILEPGSGTAGKEPGSDPLPVPGEAPTPGQSQGESPQGTQGLQVYSRYDFVPGEELILYDDFSPDQVGDFPAQWNANGSGEIVNIAGQDDKWLRLKDNTVYLPEFENELPENFTVEFDILTTGLDRHTSSTARLHIRLEDTKDLFKGRAHANTSIPFAQYINPGIRVHNVFNGTTTVNNSVTADIREAVKSRAHVAIAVNGQRYRLWLNENKLVDLPRFVEPGVLKALKLELNGLPGDSKNQYVFLTNLRIAETGPDFRSQLMKDGRFSTTGIYFDTGSSTLQPSSAGVLKPLGDLLKQDPGLRLKIIGHTDADGSAEMNRKLSLQRAAAVKDALQENFGIDASRLEVDGKGSEEPVADNNSAAGKAKNRRVEFVKI